MQYNCVWWVVCLSCIIFQHNQLIVMHSSCYLVKLTVCCAIRFHLRLCWLPRNVSSEIREIHQPILLTSEWRICWNHAPILAGYWNWCSVLCHLLRQATSCSKVFSFLVKLDQFCSLSYLLTDQNNDRIIACGWGFGKFETLT